MLHKSSKLDKEKLKGKTELIVSYQWKIMMSNAINLTLVKGAKLGKRLWCWFLINSSWIRYGTLLLSPKSKVNFVL